MKIRYDMSSVDLAKDDPETVDLSHLPAWLEPDVRNVLRRMDYANKATGKVINIKGSIEVEVPGIGEGDEWKCELDLGSGEIVREV